MNKTSLCIAILLSLSAATHAAPGKPGVPNTPTSPTAPNTSNQLKPRTITGITLSPASPVSGQDVTATIDATGSGACHMSYKVTYPDNTAIGGDNFFSNQPAGAGKYYQAAGTSKIVFSADKPGTYTIHVFPSVWANPKCDGEATLTVFVPRPTINLARLPEIVGLTVPDSFSTNEAGKLMVDGHGLCSYHVDFGDGKAEDRTDTLPIDLRNTPTHEYANYGVPKTFTLKVKGVAGKCKGEFKKDVIVTAPNLSVSAPQAPAIPANPAVKAVCPPGKVC